MNTENKQNNYSIWGFYQALFKHEKRDVVEMLEKGILDDISPSDMTHVYKELIALKDKQIISLIASRLDYEDDELCNELFICACNVNNSYMAQIFINKGKAADYYYLLALAPDDTFRLINQLPADILTDDLKVQCLAAAAQDSRRSLGRLLALGWDLNIKNSEGKDASALLEAKIRTTSYPRNKSGSLKKKEDLRMVKALAKGEFPVDELPSELKAAAKKRKPMSKGLLAFIIVAAVCIVAGLVTFLIMNGGSDSDSTSTVSDETEAVEETEADDSSEVIFSVDVDDITKLAWTYGDDNISLVKESGAWTLENDADFPLDTTIPDTIASTVCTISGTPVEEDSETDYGFDDSDVSGVISTDSDFSIVFGYEDTDGVYAQTDDKIYIVDSSVMDAFKYCTNDLVLQDEIPEITNPTSLSVSNDIENFTADYIEDSDYVYTNKYTWFINNDDVHTALDTDAVESMISKLSGITWTSVAAVDPSDLSTYGLSDPSASMSVDYGDGETFAIDMGIGTDGSYYAQPAGSSIVYDISSDFYNNLMYCSSSELVANDVFLMDFDDVTSVDVTIDGETYTFEHTLTEVISETDSDSDTEDDSDADSDTEDDSDNDSDTEDGSEVDSDGENEITYESVWTINGEEVSADGIFAKLNSLVNKGTADASAISADADISFTFHTSSKTYPTATLAFYTVDGTHCAAQLNGEVSYLVAREKIYNIIESLLGLVQ